MTWMRIITDVHTTSDGLRVYPACPHCCKELHNVHMTYMTRESSRMGRHTYYTRMVCDNNHMFILGGKSTYPVTLNWYVRNTPLQLYEICTDDQIYNTGEYDKHTKKFDAEVRWGAAITMLKRIGIRTSFKTLGGKISLKEKL